MDFHDAVRVLVVAILVVIEDSLARRFTYLRHKPLHALDVQQTLHAKEIYCDLDNIALTHLCNGLDKGALLDALKLVRGLLKRTHTII